MKYLLMSIKDRAINMYNRPFCVRSRNEALRIFSDECNRNESEMKKHPEDYELYEVGGWDEETGLTIELKIERLARAQDHITTKE